MKLKLYPSIFNLLLLTSILLLNACRSPFYYAPNGGSNLTLSKKGDIEASMGPGSIENRGNNFTIQAGYSPMKHVGIQSSYFSSSHRFGGSIDSKGFIINGAVGVYYFLPFEKNIPSRVKFNSDYLLQPGMLLDFYSGYARGQFENNYDPKSFSSFNFQKTFIQARINIQGHRAGFDFAVKAGIVDYTNGEVYRVYDNETLSDIESINDNNPFNFFENTFRVYYGRKQLKLYFSQTILHSQNFLKNRIAQRSSSMGIIVDIDELILMTKKEKAKKKTKL